MSVDLPPEGAPPDAPAAAPAWLPRPFWTAKLALQRFVLAATGALVTILIFVQVVTRYFLGESIFGIEEAASFLAIWLYFVAARTAPTNAGTFPPAWSISSCPGIGRGRGSRSSPEP